MLPHERLDRTGSDCQGCLLTGRREFLREALAAVAGVAAALAIPGAAHALPISLTSPSARHGATRVTRGTRVTQQ